MLFSLSGVAYKAQHPAKGMCGNADMTSHGPRFAIVLDGVSGVPKPLLPESLSWDLREWLRHLLRSRFHSNQDSQEFDKTVVTTIGGNIADMSKDPPGAWLAHILHLALQSSTELGFQL